MSSSRFPTLVRFIDDTRIGVNKVNQSDLPAQPIFLGPVLLHKDATYKTYKSFLEHIKTELESDIEAVELRLPESIEFGIDDEKALTKAIDNVFHRLFEFCAPST